MQLPAHACDELVFRRAGCREIRLSGSTRGEWVAPSVSPSLLLYRETKDSHAKPPRRKEDRKVRFISNRLRIGMDKGANSTTVKYLARKNNDSTIKVLQSVPTDRTFDHARQ